uniref:Reverse transcriptase RNase H-like domain-containing protein n=1 Tax=Cajanus cajan TaxID=3821 RepID=A0A151UI61_CAJCA
MIEKLALALVTAAWRLRPYFQSHQVIVKNDYPIKQILQKPELTGRMIAWSMELSEFRIQYEGDLVWRLLGEARKDTSDGKLAPTWGGPF